MFLFIRTEMKNQQGSSIIFPILLFLPATHCKQNFLSLLTSMPDCRILTIEPDFIFYYEIHSVVPHFTFWLPLSLPILQPSTHAWTPLLPELFSQQMFLCNWCWEEGVTCSNRSPVMAKLECINVCLKLPHLSYTLWEITVTPRGIVFKWIIFCSKNLNHSANTKLNSYVPQ